jgi:flagellar basal-body rod protein FlgF
MSGAIDVVQPSLAAISTQYEATAHNLANANTTGYKRLVVALAAAPAAPGLEGLPTPGGVAVVIEKTAVDFSQGNLIRTERPLDMALTGKGFFVLETPDGPLYTRNGTFQTNAQGQLVDSAGRTVAGEGGPIIIPLKGAARSLSVSSDGRISAGGVQIGKLRLVEFDDPQVLVPVGQSAFRAPAGVTPPAAAKTTVQQGFQESSNVSAVDELVNLITATRLYEANLKSVQMTAEGTKSLLGVALG